MDQNQRKNIWLLGMTSGMILFLLMVYILVKQPELLHKIDVSGQLLYQLVSSHDGLTSFFTYITTLGNRHAFILYCILFYKILDIKEKRLRICTSILAIIFAGFSVVGTSINMYLNLDGIVSSKIAFVKAILKFFGYSLTYYAILLFVYTKVFPVLKRKEDKKYRWFTNNKRSFFLVAIIIFIAYIPYFLTEYPGVFTADSVRELSDAT